MNSENNDKNKEIMQFMGEMARQEAQLQRGYNRMTFIAGAILGLIVAAQNPSYLLGWIVSPLITGGFLVFIRKALKN